MPIQEITVQHIRTILDRIHARSGPSDTLKKTRQGLSQIFRYAAIDGRVTQDPVEPLKRYDKYLCTKPKQHRPSIIDRGETEIIDLYAIGGLLRAVECYTGHLYIRFGLRLLAYLAVRPGELISARWEDFDLDNRIWLLPAYQKKERRDLVVPLPPQAVEILRHLHASTGHTEYVLSSIQGHSEVLSENTLARALWRMGYKGKHTPHGYRSLFRTCLVEVLGYNKDWVEAQLGHVSRDPNGRAYDRVTWIAERTNMMAVWATFLDMVKEGHRIDDEVIQNLKTQQQAKHSKVVPLYRNSAA
jgi:integrase